MSRAQLLKAFMARMPYVGLLGMSCDVRGDEMTAIMHYREDLIGNAGLMAMHGGAIGSFLEITAMAQVFLHIEGEAMPKTIDLTVDYLRTAGPQDLYARASVKKLGRRIANVQAEAWQGERAKPVAAFHGHFLVGG